jgi:LPS export ABC transporter protein LptC
VTLTAQKGILKTDTNDFQVNGQVVVKSPEYKMETDELRYSHGSRIIFTNVPADITGKSLKFRADKISFDLKSHKARLEGNVKGIIRGTIGF